MNNSANALQLSLVYYRTISFDPHNSHMGWRGQESLCLLVSWSNKVHGTEMTKSPMARVRGLELATFIPMIFSNYFVLCCLQWQLWERLEKSLSVQDALSWSLLGKGKTFGGDIGKGTFPFFSLFFICFASWWESGETWRPPETHPIICYSAYKGPNPL